MTELSEAAHPNNISVFQEREDIDEEEVSLKNMEDLPYSVKEFFGVMYSKHNKKNLVIKIEYQNEENRL